MTPLPPLLAALEATFGPSTGRVVVSTTTLRLRPVRLEPEPDDPADDD